MTHTLDKAARRRRNRQISAHSLRLAAEHLEAAFAEIDTVQRDAINKHITLDLPDDCDSIVEALELGWMPPKMISILHTIANQLDA